MAKSQAERTAQSEAKKKAAGEEGLRHRVRPGILVMMADLMRWGGLKSITEALQHIIINLHALGPEGAADLLKPPRHEIRISEKVAQRFEEESRRELRRDPGDDPEHPPH